MLADAVLEAFQNRNCKEMANLGHRTAGVLADNGNESPSLRPDRLLGASAASCFEGLASMNGTAVE